jgi:sugar phosphate permease
LPHLALAAQGDEQRIVGMLIRRLIPFLALIYAVAYVDRSVVGFAKLHMNAVIGLSDAAYGLGAGLFFIGYFLCEVPRQARHDDSGPSRVEPRQYA